MVYGDWYNIIYPIYTYNYFDLNRFIDNNERLTLERRNIFRTYRILIFLSCVLHKEKEHSHTPTCI